MLKFKFKIKFISNSSFLYMYLVYKAQSQIIAAIDLGKSASVIRKEVLLLVYYYLLTKHVWPIPWRHKLEKTLLARI